MGSGELGDRPVVVGHSDPQLAIQPGVPAHQRDAGGVEPLDLAVVLVTAGETVAAGEHLRGVERAPLDAGFLCRAEGDAGA